MLKVKELSYQWDHQKIFKDISFELGNGELLRVSGSNGTGKTTLLKVLAGLLKPASGSYSYTESAATKKQFDYLPASHNGLFLELNAIENLAFWANLYNTSTDAKHLSSIVGKWLPMKNRYIDSLPVKKFSTGMQRRLSFARIEACKRMFLLLDEPSSGLDREGLALLYEFLESHIVGKGSAIVVSHDTSMTDRKINHRTLELV